MTHLGRPHFATMFRFTNATPGLNAVVVLQSPLCSARTHCVVVVNRHAVVVDYRAFGVLPSFYPPRNRPLCLVDSFVNTARNPASSWARRKGRRPPFIFLFIVVDVEGWVATTASSALVLGLRHGTEKQARLILRRPYSAAMFKVILAQRRPRHQTPAPVAGQKRPPSPSNPSEKPCACHTGPIDQKYQCHQIVKVVEALDPLVGPCARTSVCFDHRLRPSRPAGSI